MTNAPVWGRLRICVKSSHRATGCLPGSRSSTKVHICGQKTERHISLTWQAFPRRVGKPFSGHPNRLQHHHLPLLMTGYIPGVRGSSDTAGEFGVATMFIARARPSAQELGPEWGVALASSRRHPGLGCGPLGHPPGIRQQYPLLLRPHCHPEQCRF